MSPIIESSLMQQHQAFLDQVDPIGAAFGTITGVGIAAQMVGGSGGGAPPVAEVIKG